MYSYTYYVYIMTNKRNGTLYTGMTNHLFQRVYDHKQGAGSVFTKKYGINKLVYFEETDDVGAAIHRENRSKNGVEHGKLP